MTTEFCWHCSLALVAGGCVCDPETLKRAEIDLGWQSRTEYDDGSDPCFWNLEHCFKMHEQEQRAEYEFTTINAWQLHAESLDMNYRYNRDYYEPAQERDEAEEPEVLAEMFPEDDPFIVLTVPERRVTV